MDCTVELNWLENEPGTGAGKYVRKDDSRLLALLANCPCDCCSQRDECRTTSHECVAFKAWVQTGKPQRR